jgi:hypothetical protein
MHLPHHHYGDPYRVDTMIPTVFPTIGAAISGATYIRFMRRISVRREPSEENWQSRPARFRDVAASPVSREDDVP